MRYITRIMLTLTALLLYFTSEVNASEIVTDSTVSVILLNNGASIKGYIVVDEPDQPVVIIRQSDSMKFELPRKKIFRITDPEHFAEVRAEYDNIPKKKPLLDDPEIWTFPGIAWGESELHFCADGLGLYRAGDAYRVGLGVGYSFEENGILTLVAHGHRNLGSAKIRLNLFVEAGYTVRFVGDEFDSGGNGGWVLSTGIGFREFSTDWFDWIGRIGYRYLALGECASDEGRPNRHYLIAQIGFAF